MKSYDVSSLKLQRRSITTYTYIITDKATKKTAIIDPAWELDTILHQLNRLDVKLEIILLTHSHFDHVDLVDPLVDLFGPAVYMHRTEIGDYGFRCGNLYAFTDYDVIQLGETVVRMIWTPGHTNGSACFWASHDLFTGDTLFTEGVGICSPEIGGCAKKLFKTTQRLKAIIPGDISIYPGHSYWEPPGRTFQEVCDRNIYLHIDNEHDFISLRTQMPADPSHLYGR